MVHLDAEAADARHAVLADCHAMLASNQRTTSEVRDRLRRSEHDPELIEWAVERCVAAGLLDDERYAALWVESRVRRGHGAQRIRTDLARKGITGEVVDTMLAAAGEDGDLDAAARAALGGKFRPEDLADMKTRARAMRFLIRRGFTGDQADRAIREFRADVA